MVRVNQAEHAPDSRLLDNSAIGFLCGTSVLCRLGGYRGSQLLEALSRVKIGDSEQSLRALAHRFPWNSQLDPPGANLHEFAISPWLDLAMRQPFRWVIPIFIQRLPTTLRREIGLRDFTAGGLIRVERGTVAMVTAGVSLEGHDRWLRVDWELVSELPSYPQIPGRESAFTPGHLHVGGELGDALRAVITPQASDADKAAARNINMKCLTSLTGCANLEDLAPDAARRLPH